MLDPQMASRSSKPARGARLRMATGSHEPIQNPLLAESIDCMGPAAIASPPATKGNGEAAAKPATAEPICIKSNLRYDQLLRYVERTPSLSILEIGVARAANTLRMMAYADQLGGVPKYVGIDLFGSLSESQFAESYCHENKRPQTRAATMDMLRERLGIDIALRIMLIEGTSGDVLPQLGAAEFRFDLIFIDGGHSYEVVKSDWRHAAALCAPGGTIVFDDYPNWGIGPVVGEIDTSQWQVRVLPHKDTFRNHRTDEDPSEFRSHQLVEVTRRGD